MFTSLRLMNFRTHRDSQINLTDLTLIIGSNNSGKSNFLNGIHYISKLVSAFNPKKNEEPYNLRPSNYYPNTHSLSKEEEPIGFICNWSSSIGSIVYNLSVFPDKKDDKIILCNEKLIFVKGQNVSTYENGIENKAYALLLRKQIHFSKIDHEVKDGINDFFHSLATIYYYNLQPSFLKGEAYVANFQNGVRSPIPKRDYVQESLRTNFYPYIPGELGKEGANLQELLIYIKENDEETYNRFSGYLKRFAKNFNGLIVKEKQLKWQFDMGNSNFPYYDSDKISDGVIKAAAVALLCALRRPPSLIMIEEVENGINQKKLTEFLSWLIHTSDNSEKTQFIITSHSPSVIREFSRKLDYVFNFHLREKDYITRVTNINDAIKPLVNMGTVEEEASFERNGVTVISVKPYHLVELFYNGVLGEL